MRGERADSVRQHADAIAREPAQYRSGSGRTEAGRADARLARKRFANAWAKLTRKVGRIEDGEASEDVLRAAPDAGDDHLAFFAIIVRVMRILRASRCGLRGRRARGSRVGCCSQGRPGNEGERGRARET